MCSGNALCLCLRLGIDLELCSKREHSEDDIGDDAAKQVLILGGVEDGGVQNNDINTKSLCEKLPFRADGRVDELLQEEKCFSLKDLAVNGNDMMAIGLKGKSIGNALQACLDAVMDERVANDHTALLTLAQEQMIADTDQILSDFANDYKRMS